MSYEFYTIGKSIQNKFSYVISTFNKYQKNKSEIFDKKHIVSKYIKYMRADNIHGLYDNVKTITKELNGNYSDDEISHMISLWNDINYDIFVYKCVKYAVKNNDITYLNMLLTENDNIDYIGHLAIKYGCLEIFRKYRKNDMKLAVAYGRVEIIKELFDKKIDYTNEIIDCIEFDYINCIEFFIQNKAVYDIDKIFTYMTRNFNKLIYTEMFNMKLNINMVNSLADIKHYNKIIEMFDGNYVNECLIVLVNADVNTLKKFIKKVGKIDIHFNDDYIIRKLCSNVFYDHKMLKYILKEYGMNFKQPIIFSDISITNLFKKYIPGMCKFIGNEIRMI